MNTIKTNRAMTHWVPGVPATDGAGVKLTRMIGTPQLDMVDPFLMLDRMDTDDPESYIAGFPDHPHRGFETVTLVLDGLMRHKDSVGNEGVLGPGDVQWMTAGRGIIHSEIPEMIEGRLSGFQLWVNLPSHLKMTAPTYQDIPAGEIPHSNFKGGRARVIAGKYGKEAGPAIPKIDARLLDVVLDADVPWSINPALEMQIFICVYEGSIIAIDKIERSQNVPAPAVALFHDSGNLEIMAGNSGASLLYCEGKPINEPVARMGPFVMNTQAQLRQAVEDYNTGRLAT